MQFCLKLLFTVFFFMVLCAPAFSQGTDRIKYKASGSLENSIIDGQEVRKLIENVVITHKNTTIFGDSAYIFQDRNSAEVFGRTVRVLEGDTITITGKHLIYDGNTKVAQMIGDVVYVDPTMTLYTDELIYDMPAKMAIYNTGGRIVDENNELTSIKGYYQTDIKFVSFKEDVVLVNPDLTIESDTLQYNTITKVAYVKGPTVITTKDSVVLNTIEGEFNTISKQSKFAKGEVENGSFILVGDTLFADDLNKIYKASENIVMTSLEDEIIITGDQGDYYKLEGITYVYGNALMKKALDQDTLYLSADSLVSIDDGEGNTEMLKAYHNVKIFKNDLQGVADSLTYNLADSTLHFFYDPVLWSEGNQMIADSIKIQISNGNIDKMYMVSNSLVVSQDTVKNFNQVRGRDMIAHFQEGKINRVNVYGNSETLYYTLEDTMLVGLNRSLSSNMLIKFLDGELNGITYYTQIDASEIPPHEIEEPDTRLKGFIWREEERPEKEDVIIPKKAEEPISKAKDGKKQAQLMEK